MEDDQCKEEIIMFDGRCNGGKKNILETVSVQRGKNWKTISVKSGLMREENGKQSV